MIVGFSAIHDPTILENIQRHTFRQSNNGNSFYYMATYGKWYIGPTTGGEARGVEVNSVEICADEIADTEWFEWNGTQWVEIENFEITCISDEHYEKLNDHQIVDSSEHKNNADSLSSPRSVKVDFSSDVSPIEDAVLTQTYSNEGFDVENIIEDDPRDIYFVLPNWTQLWNTHTTGYPIYSSNYPGGVFQSSEGYEFELEIYPQECHRKVDLEEFSLDLQLSVLIIPE